MITLALTPGCPAGIGPELFPKALLMTRLRKETRFLWCASQALFVKNAKAQGLSFSKDGQKVFLHTPSKTVSIDCLVPDHEDSSLLVSPGQPSTHALYAQRAALDLAIKLAKENIAHAIVTGPARKSALLVDGKTMGQTEYLHRSLNSDNLPPLMCFAGTKFLMGLATVHIPLKKVSESLTQEGLRQSLQRLDQACRTFFALKGQPPQIACLGLNPHAGEGGLLGDEEARIISPVIDSLNRTGIKIQGPFAADGFFAELPYKKGDEIPHAVMSMYHDQGLTAYKLLAQRKAVNMTIGLRVVRTSPAHGTADALAGSYLADPTSLAKSIEIAQKMVILGQ